MITVTVTGRMESLGRQEVEIPCPQCSLHSWVTFAQILRRDFAVCRGCHANILLDDHMGTVKNAVRRFDAAFNSLLKAFG
jgi:hypothetical protein